MESFHKYDKYEHLFYLAIFNLDTNKIIVGYGDCKYSALKLEEGKQLEFSKEELDTEITRLKAEYNAQAYARNRASEYPITGDQLDMMYKDTKNSTTTHAAAVEAVKTKWPKDNSGPVE